MTETEKASIRIRSLVRQTMDDNPRVVEPRDIADLVMAQVPDDVEAMRSILALLMPRFVTQVFGESRRDAGHGRSNVTHIAQKTPGFSAKGHSIRNHWQLELQSRVCGDEGKYVLLGEATYDDLMAGAERRQKFADKNKREAHRYRQLALSLKEAGVQCLNELPAQKQMELLTAA